MPTWAATFRTILRARRGRFFFARALRLFAQCATPLVAGAVLIVAVVVSPPSAVAHQSDTCPTGTTPLRFQVVTGETAPCVEPWRLEVLEWCAREGSANGFTIVQPESSINTGIYTDDPDHTERNDPDHEIYRNESGKWLCKIGTGVWSNASLSDDYPSSKINVCTAAGYGYYVDTQSLYGLGSLTFGNTAVKDVTFYCMPKKVGDYYDTEFDRCNRKNYREKWDSERHQCVSQPTAPQNAAVRLLMLGQVEVSWQKPESPTDYYVVRASTNGAQWISLATVTATVNRSTVEGREFTVTVNAPDSNFRYRYQVAPYSRKFPDRPPMAAEAGALIAGGFTALCSAAGWSNANFGHCPVPLINISTGETTSGCRLFMVPHLPAKDNILCQNIFGDGRQVRAFPLYDHTNTNDRYVHDCPVGAPSADYKICQCPNANDYTQNGKECHVNQDCDAQYRVQENPYTCGACVADSTEVGGECLPHRNCAADENRAAGDELYTCGACLEGHREYGRGDERLCRPNVRILPRDLTRHCENAGGTALDVADSFSRYAGKFCSFASGSGKNSCYSLDYGSAGADEAKSSSTLYEFKDGGLSGSNKWSAGTCDNDYPACSGTGFVNRDGNPLKACECPANYEETDGGSACRFNCEDVRFREDGADLSSCGACLTEYVEDEFGGEVCRPKANCEDENRLRINAYTCGGCLEGYGADGSVCQAKVDCPEGRVQLTPYSCGECAAGYTRDSAGECKPIPCPSGFADANGNCPETPQAEQCLGAAADGASLKRWGAKLDDGRCLPVQTCLFGTGSGALTPLRQAAASSQMTGCHLWSDTGRPEAGFRTMTVIAGMTVKASVSYLRESGECSGVQMEGEFQVDGYANPTLYAPSCHAGLFNCPAGLKDPNNPFSLCNPNLDYDQTNCEAAEGVWKEITSQPDDPASLERADSCKIGADVCYTGAKKNFDETVGTFYDYRTLRNRPGEHLTPVERDAQYPLSGYVYTTVIVACETEYPSDCGSGVLRVPGNPFSGCSSIPLTNPGVPRVSASSDGATLEWAPSGGDAANSVLGYSVWRETDGAAFVSIAFTTGTIYADAGAQPESMVRYRVSAHVPSDDVLLSDPSEAVRIPGCLLNEHTAISRSDLPPLCVPNATPPSAAQKCADAGWNVLYRKSAPSHVRCDVSSRDAQSGHVENCGLWGSYENACSDVFGANFDFPANDGHPRRFVFNCDAGRVPDAEYVKYAGYPRQECVCDAGLYEDARTGECASCADLNRDSSPIAGICGECLSPQEPDGTCRLVRTVRATATPTFGGAVQLSGAGAETAQGAYVTITARPATGYYVSGWGGDSRCEAVGRGNPDEEKACILRVNANVDVTAYFSVACDSEGNCLSPGGLSLAVEVRKPSPDLTKVLTLLNSSSPDIKIMGAPLIFVAATLGHADVVSVLITFGANPNAQFDHNYLPEHLARNGRTGNNASPNPTLPWRTAASVLMHFGDAGRIVAQTSNVTYNWAEDRGDSHALVLLSHIYNNFLRSSDADQEARDKKAVEVMGGYMLDQGARCPGSIAIHAVCTSRLSCPSVSGGRISSCGACPNYPYRSANGNSCAALCDPVKERVVAGWPEQSCDCADGYQRISGVCGKNQAPGRAPFLNAALIGSPGAPMVALSWQAPENEGPPLTRYEFRHGFANPGASAPNCDNADFGSQLDSPSAAFSGIGGGRTQVMQSVVNYYGQCALYQIAGVNSVGTGELQDSALLYIQHPPGSPGAVRASLLENSRISLSWNAVSEANRLGAVISGYEILRKADNGDFVSVGFAPSPSYEDNFPPLGATVRYQVRAQSSAGAGALSGETSAIDVPGERIDYASALVAELTRPSPSLATVQLYLRNGADANVTINGVAALLSAAERGRADLVRALVAAGADVNARHPNVFDRNVAHLMANNNHDRGAQRLSWDAAWDVLFAFGGAMVQRGASFNWNATDRLASRPLEYFYANYLPASAEDRATMKRMSNYMIALGATCRNAKKAEQILHPELCEGSPGPGAPATFSAELSGDERTRTALSWSAPFANGSPVTGYKFWKVGGAPAAGKTSCEDYDFPPITPSTPTVSVPVASANALMAVHVLGREGYGLCHRYGIAAINENGEGAIAESAGFYAQFEPTTLAPPRVAVGSDRVPVVSWNRLTNLQTERRGAVITVYELQRRTGPAGTWAKLSDVSHAESSYRDVNVAAGRSYYYRIRTRSSAGPGDYSDSSAEAAIPSGGNCLIGQFQIQNQNPVMCVVIGERCEEDERDGDGRFDNKHWQVDGTRAACKCLDGYEYLDPNGSRYCVRSGEPGEPQSGDRKNLGDSENPAMIETVIQACADASANYVRLPTADVVSNLGPVLGYQQLCGVYTQRVTPQGLENPQSECVLATQEFINDVRRSPVTFLLDDDALFCHEVFPELEGAQASVGVIPSGHDAGNPYVYGECPPGQNLDRRLNRCLKDCASGPSTNLGQGEVSGLVLIPGSNAEEDSCACPAGEFLDETACVSACPAGEREITDGDGLTSCLDENNVSNAPDHCGLASGEGVRIVGTYADGNLAVLCPVDRDINSLDSETVYTSGLCWLSASPGYKALLPSPTDPNHVPSCEDLAEESETPGAEPSLPTDFGTGNVPITFGTCPEGKDLESGADCECTNPNEIEQGSYCFNPEEEVTPPNADGDALRKLCEDAFHGKAEDAGNGQIVCSEVDANDTFCIMGSSGAFPCEGLFRHVRDCNFAGRPAQRGRLALNPFFCGRVCELGYAAGDECVFTSSEFQRAHGETAESLRTALTVAAGYTGQLFTVNLTRTIPGLPPLFSVELPHLYSVQQSGVLWSVSPLSANTGDARNSLAVVRISHPEDDRVYFSLRARLEWVDAPKYATLTHGQNDEALTTPYVIAQKTAGGIAHPLLKEVNGSGAYLLRGIDDSQGTPVVGNNPSVLRRYYSVVRNSGFIVLGSEKLSSGTYELEVSFAHPDMAGDLMLRIPVTIE